MNLNHSNRKKRSEDFLPIASLPHNIPPKIASVHDVSCIGRCATTVILPVLSVCGMQTCPLPTALLSTHTGGYHGFTFLDLTQEMSKIIAHWTSINTVFDAVYSGFLGSENQIELVLEFAKTYKERKPNLLFFADPVMGDDGQPYATYTKEMCRKTRDLVSYADVITPNLTEACILLNTTYRENFAVDEIKDMAKELSTLGAKAVIITGVHKEEQVGACYYDKITDTHGAYFTPRDPNNYPGAGDVFASIVLAGLLKKRSLDIAVKTACDFVYQASQYTTSLGTPLREGLAFEPLLSQLR